MPITPYRLDTVVATLENGAILAWPLRHDGVSVLGRNVARLRKELKRATARQLKQQSLLTHYRHRAVGSPQVREVTVEFEPSQRGPAWRHAVELSFHAVVWEHGREAVLAYVPALGIEVLAPDAEELEKLLPVEIRHALLRQEAGKSLERLIGMQRFAGLRVVGMPFGWPTPSPKQAAQAALQEEERPVLPRLATDLTKLTHAPVFERDKLVEQLAETLAGKRPRGVLLIGPSGVGKTAVVMELVRRRAELNLANVPFWSTSGARLVSGMCGFGAWQERCQKLCTEVSKTKAVLHVGNLVELAEVGKYEGNDQGVASFLRPHFDRGDVLAIAECTPEQLAILERENPNLLDPFVQLRVDEPTLEQGRAILRSYAARRIRTTSAPLDDRALDAIDRLHRRYATYSAYPGRPLRFLRNLLDDRRGGGLITSVDVTRVFSAETGLPLQLLDESERLDLAAAGEWFRGRVLGQESAVELIVDLLATVKAGLARPRRPIASLLFIGPTGVGKTEMAKALAEFLYRDPRRMTRIDMSEYADPASVDRLIGGTFQHEGLLTAKIREQPFGVVLLDEFEKADARLFDMLLQVLGEGRLTDAAGRVADFSNSVVIMTSNLGADSQRRASLGFGEPAAAVERIRDHYLGEVRRFMRPELFNRIDRVVPFDPLSELLLRGIAKRELSLLLERDGLRYRDVALTWSDGLAAHLARLGHDPRYGARPLKRAMERELLSPLAAGLNGFTDDTPLAAEAAFEGESLRVRVAGARAGDVAVAAFARTRAGETVPGNVSSALRAAASQANSCTLLRRKAVKLSQSHVVLGLKNELFRLARQERKALQAVTLSPEMTLLLQKCAVLRKLIGRVAEMERLAVELEEQVLVACYSGQAAPRNAGEESLHRWAAFEELVLDLYAHGFEKAQSVLLWVYGEDPAAICELTAAYLHTCGKSSLRASMYEALPLTDDERRRFPANRFPIGAKAGEDLFMLQSQGKTVLLGRMIKKPAPYFVSPPDALLGLALNIRGPLAYPRFEAEGGLHLVVRDSKTHRCLVDPSSLPLADYAPPERIDRKGTIVNQPPRRTCDFDRHLVEDHALKLRDSMGISFAETLAHYIEKHLAAQAETYLNCRVESAMN